jgi:2-hydroxychromene-2-carboxylate isomerase
MELLSPNYYGDKKGFCTFCVVSTPHHLPGLEKPMERIPNVTQTYQKRDVRCTTRTAGLGYLFGLYKRQNSVGLTRNMVTVKIGNEATFNVFKFTVPIFTYILA